MAIDLVHRYLNEDKNIYDDFEFKKKPLVFVVYTKNMF